MQQCRGGLAPRHGTRMAYRRRRARDQGRRRPGRRGRRRRPAGALDPATPGRARSAPGAGRGPHGRPGVHCSGRQDLPALDVRHPHPAVLRAGDAEGVPVNPARYDYRRAALDALHFPKLVDRFWQNLRAAPATRSSTSPPSSRSGAWPRTCTPRSGGPSPARCCARSGPPPTTSSGGRPTTLPSMWTGCPVWTDARLRRPEHRRAAPDAGTRRSTRSTPTRGRAGARRSVRGPGRHPGPHRRQTGGGTGHRLHVQVPDQADRRHLRRRDDASAAREAHIDRLAEEVRWLPCTPTCATGSATASNPPAPGRDRARALHAQGARPHQPGLGGRRVLVSRKWSGKTLAAHKADRAAVVRAALEEAGIDPDDHDELPSPAPTADGPGSSSAAAGSTPPPTPRPSPSHHHPAAMAGRVRRGQGSSAGRRRHRQTAISSTIDPRVRESRHEQDHRQAADRPPGRRAPGYHGAVPSPPDRRAADHVRARRRHVRIPEGALDELIEAGTVEAVERSSRWGAA